MKSMLIGKHQHNQASDLANACLHKSISLTKLSFRNISVIDTNNRAPRNEKNVPLKRQVLNYIIRVKDSQNYQVVRTTAFWTSPKSKPLCPTARNRCFQHVKSGPNQSPYCHDHSRSIKIETREAQQNHSVECKVLEFWIPKSFIPDIPLAS